MPSVSIQVEPAIIEINVCQNVMRTSVIFVMKNEEAYLKSLDTFPERFLEGIADHKDLPWCKHDTDVLLPDMAIQVIFSPELLPVVCICQDDYCHAFPSPNLKLN